MARLVLAPSSERVEDVRVVSVDRRRRRVELSRHPDTVVPGRYSLFYGNERGHAQLGDILFVSETTVTRELIAETRGKLSAGMKARVSGWFYEGPADLQVAFEEVEVATPLGQRPRGWYLPHEEACAVIVTRGSFRCTVAGLTAANLFGRFRCSATLGTPRS